MKPMPLDAMKMTVVIIFFASALPDAQVIRDTTRQGKTPLRTLAYLRSFLSRFFHPKASIPTARWMAVRTVKSHSTLHRQRRPDCPGTLPHWTRTFLKRRVILNICAYDVHSWWHYFVRCLETVATRVSPAASPEVLGTIRQSIEVQTKQPSMCMVMEKHVRRRGHD